MATTLGNGMVLMDSFPFDSSPNLVFTDEGYPRGDRSVDAWTMRSTFKQFFSNGVFGTPANALQIGKGESGMTVTIQPGMCIIEGGMGGVSEKEGQLVLTLDTQAAQGNTPYGIMLRYDDNSDVRGLVFRVVKGTAGSNPTPPEPDTSSPNVYELRLGYVVVPNGASDMSSATVYNEKGTAVCPYAAPFEEIDISEIVADARSQAQEVTNAFLTYAQTYYDLVASALDGTTADNLQQQIDNISPANFVDNVTLVQTSDGKMQVKDSGIVTAKISDESVTTDKIADGSVTIEKLEAGVLKFTDDPDSTSTASQRVAATPALVNAKMSGKTKEAFGYKAVQKTNTEQNVLVNNYDFTINTEINGFSMGIDKFHIKADKDLVVFINISLAKYSNSEMWIRVDVNNQTVIDSRDYTSSSSYNVSRNLSAMVEVDAGEEISINSPGYVIVFGLIIQGVA